MYSAEPIQPGDTVLLGDSLTEGFDIRRFFHDRPVKNRGISGDTATHLRYRLNEITGSCPGKLFLMIGINDLFNGSEPESIAREINDIILDVREHCPSIRIFLQSILPVHEGSFLIFNDINLLIYKTNDILKRVGRETGADYLDLHSHFLDDEGQLGNEYTFDGVHLSSRAYQLWAKLIEDRI